LQLFNPKTIKRHVARAGAPDPVKLETLRQWAATIRDRSIETQKETALHGKFKREIICDVLGYSDFNESGAWTVEAEAAIGSGAVDLALGHFKTGGESRIIAPFELKGAKTKDLDAIMPGRAKTPVQQAWEYAADNVGTKWVLVSNYLEIRLYSYANGRQFHEAFDLAKLTDPEQYHRFMLLLAAGNLLTGRTLELLEESRKEDRDITARLYSDYRTLRSELIGAVQAALPKGDPLEAIRLGQTILDRVLFTAFAEDNGLLPDNSLLQAFEHRDPYNPKPIWQNFCGLFQAIDKGNEELKIPRYNGGLFQPNPVIDAMAIPDHICERFKLLGEYDFASEISVTVLGHIFEQSIADVEQLQAEARGEAVPEKKTTGTSGRRKRDGVVYTPDYIARFIVEQTLGTHCREIFARILGEYAAKGATADDEEISWKSKAAEKQAWAEYRNRLTALRIIDPACGSGVFLIMAFDWLKAELVRVNAKLAELEGLGMAGSLLDPDSEILTHNLFGVDVNSESVEIAKLSLWIKTARRGKVLDSLDANIRVGDSLIEDSSYAYRSHGFEWKSAFPDIFAGGGFDVCLGNPPYVRMELIKPMKPWLEKRYEVVADRADLYAYFFERGIKLLKPGGRLGYISSSTFFKTGSGAPLRDFLRKNSTIETVVDFGDHQIFEGVTTYPAILTMRAEPPEPGHKLWFWTIDQMPADSFEGAFDDAAQGFPQAALGRRSWELEAPELQALRAKITAGKPTLKDVYGSPLYGIKTGLNEAFVIDTPTKEKLCAADPRSAELLKPWLEGKDLKRWRAEPRGLWIIYIPKNRIKIDDFPAIRDWLLPFREQLEKRATKQEWFELQQAQEAFSGGFGSKKINYLDIATANPFSMDCTGSYLANTAYGIPSDCYFLLGVLNSRVFWFFYSALSAQIRGGYSRLLYQFIILTPIPAASDAQKTELGSLAEAAQSAAEQRYELQQSITRRIPDLAADPSNAKLTTRLKEWWTLPDFAAFHREVEKALKARIPLLERTEWENWITTTRAEINALTAEITRLEAEINAKVYELFDLTPAEIGLLEASI
jgi:N-6 DNA Methylase/TaqI-like C-terminal specificity domain